MVYKFLLFWPEIYSLKDRQHGVFVSMIISYFHCECIKTVPVKGEGGEGEDNLVVVVGEMMLISAASIITKQGRDRF